MTPESWERAESLFHEALELEPGRRSAFLDARCGGNLGLRAELATLLASDDEASPHFLLESPREGRLAEAQCSLFGDRYQVLGLLGEGSRTDVYLARDRILDRDIALKMARRGGRSGSARLAAEARILSRLAHPGIVPLLDMGLTRQGRAYYTMPATSGLTLRDVLQSLRVPGQAPSETWPLERRLRAFVSLARIVARAHASAVVHGDLKPANVMLGSHDRVHLLDWNLARLMEGESASAPPERRRGFITGTPSYMSPQRVRGARPDRADDMWSLGVILYELLTLRRPFEGTTLEQMRAILGKEPQPPRAHASAGEFPPHWEAIAMKALRKSPAERFASVAELLERAQVVDDL